MAFSCKLLGHKWNGSCKCEKCGALRDEGHKWNHCACEVCGAERHKWNHCTCEVCGIERKHGHLIKHHRVGLTVHDFKQVPDSCLEKCIWCGKEIPNNRSEYDRSHQWVHVQGQCEEHCRICRMVRTKHHWEPAPSECRKKCAVCGEVFVNERLHTFDKSGICTACGLEGSYCTLHGHDFIDIGPAGNGRKMQCSRCGDIMTTAYDPDFYR